MKYIEKAALVVLFSIVISLLLSVAVQISSGSAFSISAILTDMSDFMIIGLPVIMFILFIELINESLKGRFRVKNWSDLTIDKKLISVGWKVALGSMALLLFIFTNLETLTKRA